MTAGLIAERSSRAPSTAALAGISSLRSRWTRGSHCTSNCVSACPLRAGSACPPCPGSCRGDFLVMLIAVIGLAVLRELQGDRTAHVPFLPGVGLAAGL